MDLYSVQVKILKLVRVLLVEAQATLSSGGLGKLPTVRVIQLEGLSLP
jgi:hypothetical protein